MSAADPIAAVAAVVNDAAAKQAAGATRQGYLIELRRPACRNCLAYLEESSFCGYGNFPVQLGGWCHVWMPSRAWIEQHPHSAQAMGLSLGQPRET